MLELGHEPQAPISSNLTTGPSISASATSPLIMKLIDKPSTQVTKDAYKKGLKIQKRIRGNSPICLQEWSHLIQYFLNVLSGQR